MVLFSLPFSSIKLDLTNLAKENLNPVNVKIFNDKQIVDVDQTRLEEFSTFSALSQTGHSITYKTASFGSVSFLRLSNRVIQYTDNLSTVDLSGSTFDSSNSVIIENDTDEYIIISNN